MAADPEQRAALAQIINTTVIPRFLSFAVTQSGVYENNWLGTLGTGNYERNFWIRNSANLAGLWANTSEEVIYFVATRDANGYQLNGANDYLLEFPAGNGPDTVVDAYWSIILVEGVKGRARGPMVVP